MKINKIQEKIKALTQQKKEIIHLSLADYSFFPSLLNDHKIEKNFSRIFEYPYYQPVSQGDPEARESIVKFYRDKEISLDAEQIILTSGSSESYLYLFKIFAENNGEILFPNPSYPLFEEIAKFVKLKLKYYRLDSENHWQPDLKELRKKIQKNTKAIVLISPNNPTGSIIDKKILDQILTLAQEKSLAIIADEVFSEFIFENTDYSSMAKVAQKYPSQIIFTLNGLSKSLALPGLKISWITVHGKKDLRQEYIQRLEYLADLFLTTNQLSQLWLPIIVKYHKKWLKDFKRKVEKNRNMTVGMLSKCPRIQFEYPNGGFCIFPRLVFRQSFKSTSSKIRFNKKEHKKHLFIEREINDEEFALMLLEKENIYVHPGYYYDYPENSHFLICFLQDPKVLRSSLKKIISFIKKL